MQTVERYLNHGLLAMMIVAAAALGLMMFHITLDVFFRYAFNRPFAETVDVVAYYYMIAVVFLPLAFVERRSEHIEVELFTQHLPVRVRNLLFIAARLFAVAFFGVLAWQTYLDALGYMAIREAPMGSRIEIWPSRFLLPLSFVVLMVTMLLHALKAALDLGAEKPQGDGPAFARKDHGPGEGA